MYFTDEYSDKYFVNTREVLELNKHNPTVTMQVFGKKEGVFCGIDEILIEMDIEGPALEIWSLEDGDTVSPWETVMFIKGYYRSFAAWETQYLGMIAESSLIATNASRVVKAANGKPVIFMGARHTHPMLQPVHGYAAYHGGIRNFCTKASVRHLGNDAKVVGTMPHGMIAAFGGDTVAATLAYAEYAYSKGYPVISLVDYDNDCIGTTIKVCEAMLERFGRLPDGVRLDTSEKLIDKCFNTSDEYAESYLTGVNPYLVTRLRNTLDRGNFGTVGIWVSGGFNPTKIETFEKGIYQGNNLGGPISVTGYGAGDSILGHNKGDEDGLLTGFSFTADVVEVNGKAESKVGRQLNHNDRLNRVI